MANRKTLLLFGKRDYTMKVGVGGGGGYGGEEDLFLKGLFAGYWDYRGLTLPLYYATFLFDAMHSPVANSSKHK